MTFGTRLPPLRRAPVRSILLRSSAALVALSVAVAAAAAAVAETTSSTLKETTVADAEQVTRSRRFV